MTTSGLALYGTLCAHRVARSERYGQCIVVNSLYIYIYIYIYSIYGHQAVRNLAATLKPLKL